MVGNSQLKTGLANRKVAFCMPKSGEGSHLGKSEVSFGQRCWRRTRRDEKRLAMNALQIDAIGPQRVPHPSASPTESVSVSLLLLLACLTFGITWSCSVAVPILA